MSKIQSAVANRTEDGQVRTAVAIAFGALGALILTNFSLNNMANQLDHAIIETANPVALKSTQRTTNIKPLRIDALNRVVTVVNQASSDKPLHPGDYCVTLTGRGTFCTSNSLKAGPK